MEAAAILQDCLYEVSAAVLANGPWSPMRPDAAASPTLNSEGPKQ